MDKLRDFEGDRGSLAEDDAPDAPPKIGSDERRMHVRAYNHWVSLLDGRAYPSIAVLDPAGIADFGTHSVLLDFTGGVENPAIAFLGRALREECALDIGVRTIAELPDRSLLSRLTDHYLQIIANRAPIGFEAEFVNTRGRAILYRGILMPFRSDGEAIDYIYGVINWKERVDAATQSVLEREVDAALVSAPPAPPAPAWADGPGVGPLAAPGSDASLSGRLASARAVAAEAAAAHIRSRAALYEALGRAHDFATAAAADPETYDAILTAADLIAQDSASLSAVAKLVFGAQTDPARLSEYTTVLAHARRVGVPRDALAQYLTATDGGVSAIVAIEHAAESLAAPPQALS